MANDVARSILRKHCERMARTGGDSLEGVKAYEALEQDISDAIEAAERGLIRGLVRALPKGAWLSLPLKVSGNYVADPRRWISRNGHKIRSSKKD